MNSSSPSAILAAVGPAGVDFALPAPAGRQPRNIEFVSVASCSTLSEALMGYAQRQAISLDGCRIFVSASGAVQQDAIRITNGPWTISRSGMYALTHMSPVIVNDVAAIGWATLADRPEQRNAGKEGVLQAARHVVILATETGLGAACVDRRDGPVRVIDSEAGHASFSAETEREWQLVDRVHRLGHHASFEVMVTDLMQTSDTGNPFCRSRDELLAIVLGRFCSTVMLAFAGWDAMWLCGSGFDRLERRRTFSAFRDAFVGRGRMRHKLGEVMNIELKDRNLGLLGLQVLHACHQDPHSGRMPTDLTIGR